MREDAAQSYKDQGPHNQTLLRHMALQLLKSDTSVKVGVQGQAQARGLGCGLSGPCPEHQSLDAIVLRGHGDRYQLASRLRLFSPRLGDQFEVNPDRREILKTQTREWRGTERLRQHPSPHSPGKAALILIVFGQQK